MPYPEMSSHDMCRTLWSTVLEIASSAITEVKAKKLSTKMLEHAHELRDRIKSEEGFVLDQMFFQMLENLADYMDVAANLDSLKETQTAMYNVSSEIKELFEEFAGESAAADFTDFLDKLWVAKLPADAVEAADALTAPTTVFDVTKPIEDDLVVVQKMHMKGLALGTWNMFCFVMSFCLFCSSCWV